MGTISAAVCAFLGVTGAAVGQCPVIDFENLAVGTAVTTQYSGVAFSVAPQSCLGSPTLQMRITAPPEGTSSGTKCIKIDQGCPSFSDDYMVITLAAAAQKVRFTLGDWATVYTVRAYSNPAGGAGSLITSIPVVLPGAGQVSVHRTVTVTSPAVNIRRIEVQGAMSNFEAIDDFEIVDETPPTAQLNAPPFGACSCGIVGFTGIACDSDGAYGQDKLEYQPVGAAPGAPWTLVGSFTTPLCTVGTLYQWDTSPASITTGSYFMRLTVTNACGVTSTDQTVVYVDKSFALPTGNVRKPESGSIIGGKVCIDGTVSDACNGDFTVRYKPAVGGAFQPVDPLSPVYSAWVTNDPFAYWNTASGVSAVTDGDYVIQVRGEDDCGNAATVLRNVTVDNTEPVAVLTGPVGCTYRCGTVSITGTVSDANLASWRLDYTTDDSGWSFLAEGSTNISGVLHSWDTGALGRCAYTLRLRAVDKASIGCDQGGNVKEAYLSFNIGAYADCNGSGTLTIADFACFQSSFVGGCP